MRAVDYNDAFVAVLRRSIDGEDGDLLKKRASEVVKNREVTRLFPGRSALWLQKELSKWRSKLDSESFNGTLHSLQIYCALTGLTPNDVLLPRDGYTGLSSIEFLRYETILSFVREIRAERKPMRQGCVLPVLYAPGRMTTVFLFLYPQKRAGADTVFLRFGISEPDGYVDADGTDCSGGVTTALDSSLHMVDIFYDDWEAKLQTAYRKIRGEFEAVSGTESQMDDAVNEFYAYMGDWTERYAGDGDPLFDWYPQKTRKASRGSGLDDMIRYTDSRRER